MSQNNDSLIDFEEKKPEKKPQTLAESDDESSSQDSEQGLRVKCVNCDKLVPLEDIEIHASTCVVKKDTLKMSSEHKNDSKKNDSSSSTSTSESAKSNNTTTASGASKSGSEAAASSSLTASSSVAPNPAAKPVADESSSLGLNLNTPSKQSSRILSDMTDAVTEWFSGNKKSKGPPELEMPDISLANPALARDYTRTTKIAFVLDDPRQGGGSFSSYVTYRVNWRTELRSFGGTKCYFVRRKYCDFEFLHRHLTRLYPHCIIPPLASPKGWMQKEFDVVFRERRMRLLQRFLNRIGNHPILAEAEILMIFLTHSKKEAWNKAMHELDEEEKKEKAGPAKNSKLYSGDAPAMNPADEEANKAAKEMRAELQEMIAGFRELHKVLETNVTTRTASQQASTVVTTQLNKFGQLEGLRRPASNIDTSPMVNALTAFSTTFASLDTLHTAAINIDSEMMWEVVRDWTYYLRAADEYLTRFFNLRSACAYSLQAYQARLKSVEKPKSDTASTEEVTDSYLKQLEETKNYDQARYETALKSFEKETIRWEVYKQREIIHWTNTYAKLQIEALQQSVAAWEGFLQKNAFRSNK